MLSDLALRYTPFATRISIAHKSLYSIADGFGAALPRDETFFEPRYAERPGAAESLFDRGKEFIDCREEHLYFLSPILDLATAALITLDESASMDTYEYSFPGGTSVQNLSGLIE